MSDRSRRYPPELKERAVRMVFEHQRLGSTRRCNDWLNPVNTCRSATPNASPK